MTPGDHSAVLEAIAAESGRDILEVTEWFLERASIAEYCGNIPRAEAEHRAIEYCRATFVPRQSDSQQPEVSRG